MNIEIANISISLGKVAKTFKFSRFPCAPFCHLVYISYKSKEKGHT